MANPEEPPPRFLVGRRQGRAPMEDRDRRLARRDAVGPGRRRRTTRPSRPAEFAGEPRPRRSATPRHPNNRLPDDGAGRRPPTMTRRPRKPPPEPAPIPVPRRRETPSPARRSRSCGGHCSGRRDEVHVVEALEREPSAAPGATSRTKSRPAPALVLLGVDVDGRSARARRAGGRPGPVGSSPSARQIGAAAVAAAARLEEHQRSVARRARRSIASSAASVARSRVGHGLRRTPSAWGRS